MFLLLIIFLYTNVVYTFLDNLVARYFYISELNDPQKRARLCEQQVISHLNCLETQVLRVNGQLYGFITYSFQLPWYRKLVGSAVGENVTIHHLAVDDTYRSQGQGSLLLRAVLEKCKNRAVNRISLWAQDQMPFYEKHGFRVVQRTKFCEYQYALRLRPLPVIEAARWVLNNIRKV